MVKLSRATTTRRSSVRPYKGFLKKKKVTRRRRVYRRPSSIFTIPVAREATENIVQRQATALWNAVTRESQIPPADTSVVEAAGTGAEATTRKAGPKPRKMCVSGELFDLTVSTMNNPFGHLKDSCAEIYGPFQPVERYIREYEMMIQADAGQGGTDDKTMKRQQRLTFLRAVAASPELSQLFLCMSGYLNGAVFELPAAARPEQEVLAQIRQMLAVLAEGGAGGNPISQARKLVTRSVRSSPAPFKMFFVGGNVILFFATLIPYFYPGHAGQLGPLQSADYSDLDYTIVPCSPQEWDLVTTRGGAGAGLMAVQAGRKNNDLKDGFLLMRVKTAFCRRTISSPPPKKTANIIRFFRERELFASPQSAQQGFLTEMKGEPDTAYMQYLLDKKALIAAATKLNVYATAFACIGRGGYVSRLPFLPTAPPLERMQAAIVGLREERDRDPTMTLGLMQYVHSTVVTANAVIHSWPRLSPMTSSGCGIGGPREATTWKGIIGSCSPRTFYGQTLGTLYDVLTGPDAPDARPFGEETMTGETQPVGRTALIPRLCTSILMTFMNSDGVIPGRPGSVSTNAIMDVVTAMYTRLGLYDPKAPAQTFKVVDMSRSPTLHSQSTDTFSVVERSEMPFPDNLAIGINQIVTGQGAVETSAGPRCTAAPETGGGAGLREKVGGRKRRFRRQSPRRRAGRGRRRSKRTRRYSRPRK